MLTFILFAAAVGIYSGAYMARGSPDGCGWLLLTAPMGTVMVGTPAALLFTVADSAALDPVLGWAGAMRTGLVAPIVPAVMVVKKHRRRRSQTKDWKRPPGYGETLIRPSLGWAIASQLLVPVWLAAKWIGEAV